MGAVHGGVGGLVDEGVAQHAVTDVLLPAPSVDQQVPVKNSSLINTPSQSGSFFIHKGCPQMFLDFGPLSLFIAFATNL